MDKSRIIQTGRPLFLFILQIIIFIACISFIEFFYYTNIYPDKHVKEAYQQTQCTILQKQLTASGDNYRSDFAVTYLFNGAKYQSYSTGNGLDLAFTSDRQSQEDILAQFDIGQDYTCWVSPKHPNRVVLVLRHSWTSTFPLLIPTIVALITLYYIFQSIFIVFGMTTQKIRTLKNRKKDDV